MAYGSIHLDTITLLSISISGYIVKRLSSGGTELVPNEVMEVTQIIDLSKIQSDKTDRDMRADSLP